MKKSIANKAIKTITALSNGTLISDIPSKDIASFIDILMDFPLPDIIEIQHPMMALNPAREKILPQGIDITNTGGLISGSHSQYQCPHCKHPLNISVNIAASNPRATRITGVKTVAKIVNQESFSNDQPKVNPGFGSLLGGVFGAEKITMNKTAIDSDGDILILSKDLLKNIKANLINPDNI